MERYVIHVTKECNMKCKYCYETDKTSTYTKDEIKEFLDNLIKFRTSNIFGIEFLGGEPMLAEDLIIFAYEYLEYHKEVEIADYVITTNGTILSEDFLDYLYHNPKIRVAISLDGHNFANQLRVLKDGKNSYDIVVKNIKRLQETGIQPSVHIVSHPYNVGYLSDSIIHLANLGIQLIGVGTVESTIQINSNYCERFIKELDKISHKIISGELKHLTVVELVNLKPINDVRTYIKDNTGKVVGESYGRSGADLTSQPIYNNIYCNEMSDTTRMINYIRNTVYQNHKNLLAKTKEVAL